MALILERFGFSYWSYETTHIMRMERDFGNGFNQS